MADKLVVIRSIVGATGDHYAFQCLTGRSHSQQPAGGWPSIGSVVSKLQGPADPAVPPFIGLAPAMGHMPWADPGQPGFLGIANAAFKPRQGAGMDDLVLKASRSIGSTIAGPCLTGLDRFRRDVDVSGTMAGMDAFKQQAFGVLTSSKLVNALDLSKEDPRVVRAIRPWRSEQPRRRRPEIDVAFPAWPGGWSKPAPGSSRCAFSRWDWHGQNFSAARQDMPLLDQGVSALVEDLYERGLDKTCRSSSGANSAARRRSTRTPAAITGRR